MMRQIGIILAFVSAIVFPWPLTACIALGLSPWEPLIPFSVGLFADTLYYVPHGSFFPLFTLYGLGTTILAFFVRSRLKASIM